MGGAATKEFGTERVKQEDIIPVLEIVSDIADLDIEYLKKCLMGSTRLTFLDASRDSGDIDLAIDRKLVIEDDLIDALTTELEADPMVIMGHTYSFPVDLGHKKVQLDIMFVRDLKWASFAYYASNKSKYKSGVRNEYLHALLKHSMIPGQDLRIYDEDLNQEIARASRSYKLSDGCLRVFKFARMRKDGNGRIKNPEKITPQQLRIELDKLGIKDQFSQKEDLILDPDKFAAILFDESVKGNQLMSAEALHKLITEKRIDAEEIFKTTIKGIINRGFEVPTELQYLV